jgi:hypothetical protein
MSRSQDIVLAPMCFDLTPRTDYMVPMTGRLIA